MMDVENLLTRARAQGFKLALDLMENIDAPTTPAAVLQRLLEVAEGETLMIGTVGEAVLDMERLEGGPLPEDRLRQVSTIFGTAIRKITVKDQEDARKLVNFIGDDFMMQRMVPSDMRSDFGIMPEWS